MTITTAYLLSYVKGIDSRLSAMTDANLLPYIQFATHNLSTQLTPFYKTETIPFQQYYDIDTLIFDITPSEDVIDFYEVKIIETLTGENSLYSNVKVERTNDKTFTVTIIDGDVVGRMQSLQLSYFYYLTPITSGSYEVEPEIWKMWIDCLNIQVWNYLKDYEKEKYHQAQLMNHISTKTLQMPYIMTSPDSMKGGFL
jgi:hypothetical protein